MLSQNKYRLVMRERTFDRHGANSGSNVRGGNVLGDGDSGSDDFGGDFHGVDEFLAMTMA